MPSRAIQISGPMVRDHLRRGRIRVRARLCELSFHDLVPHLESAMWTFSKEMSGHGLMWSCGCPSPGIMTAGISAHSSSPVASAYAL